MNSEELKARTKRFAISVLRFIEGLSYSQANKHITGQLIRSSTSIAANYRAAMRGKSNADFLYKIKIVEEEADECMYWLEIIEEINKNKVDGLETLYKEAIELTAIFSAIAKTLKYKAFK